MVPANPTRLMETWAIKWPTTPLHSSGSESSRCFNVPEKAENRSASARIYAVNIDRRRTLRGTIRCSDHKASSSGTTMTANPMVELIHQLARIAPSRPSRFWVVAALAATASSFVKTFQRSTIASSPLAWSADEYENRLRKSMMETTIPAKPSSCRRGAAALFWRGIRGLSEVCPFKVAGTIVQTFTAAWGSVVASALPLSRRNLMTVPCWNGRTGIESISAQIFRSSPMPISSRY